MQRDTTQTRFDDLVALVARLHAPAPEGCPWCLAQTPETLADELVKEAYEVAEAARQGTGALGEELGDVLLVVLALAQLEGGASGSSNLSSLLAALHEKVVRRHPHIFGQAVATTADDVLKNWDDVKRSERPSHVSILEGIPSSMPALIRADEMQQRVARVGFDWPDVDGVLSKVREEIGELEAADSLAARSEELGDLLFALANLARWLGISPERALHDANTKFARRFASIEAQCRARGARPEDFSLTELDAMWNTAKKDERAP